jgi:GNAT superfamily N-acetyltransferase
MPRVEIAFEPLSSLLDAGLAAIVERHWQEVGLHKDKMPLDVDWEKYHVLEDQGFLRLISARAGDLLVGYASFLVLPHLHYAQTLHALNDAIYVAPEYRGVGVRLIRAAEKMLAEAYVPRRVRIVYHLKTAVEADRGTFLPLYRRMGYTEFETCVDKMVQAP